MRFYHEQANLPDGAARLVDPAIAAACRMRLVNQLRNLHYDDACTDPRRREIWLLATRALFDWARSRPRFANCRFYVARSQLVQQE